MNSFDIGTSFERGANTFFEWIPNLLGAIVILIIGYIIAKVVQKLVKKGLQAIHVDEQLTKGQMGSYVTRVFDKPSRSIGTLAFWLIMLGALSLAVTTLGIPALTAFVAAIYAYLPHVIAALAIFLVAAALAGGVAGLITRVMGDTPTGKVAATAAPVLIMTVASFMILTELMIAEQIVLITYAALLGAVALGSALAFGLGGQRAAARALDSAVGAAQDNAGQIKGDIQQGKERGKQDANRAKDEARSRTQDGAPPRTTTTTLR